MQHLQKTGEGVPVMVNQSADFAASASLLQSAPATGKTTGRKARLDSRRAPSGPIVRQTRIHSRRRICSRRRFGQTPSQQRPRQRQNPPTTPSPPRPRPPRIPWQRLLSPNLSPAPQPPVQELRLLTFPAKPPAASFLPRLFACSARFATFFYQRFP